MKTRVEAIKAVFSDLRVSEKVAIWNVYASESSDEAICENGDDFFEMYFSCTMDAVRAVCYGNYRYCDDWVKFNAYGNLDSTNYPEEWIDEDYLCDWLADNERVARDLMDMDEVADILRESFNDDLREMGCDDEQIEGFDGFDADSDFEYNLSEFKEYLTSVEEE